MDRRSLESYSSWVCKTVGQDLAPKHTHRPNYGDVILAPKLWETQALIWWQTGWGVKDALCCLSLRSGNPRASKQALSLGRQRSEDVSLSPIIYITWSGAWQCRALLEQSSYLHQELTKPKETSLHSYVRTAPWEETPPSKEPFQMTVSKDQIHCETKADSKVPSLHQAGNEILYRAHHLDCIPIILKCCGAQITHSAIK